MSAVQSPTFGLLLKRHRRAAGLTQEELAERAGLSARAVGDLERGLRQPRRDTLQLLLHTLQLSTDEVARLEIAARVRTALAPGSVPAGPPLQIGSFLGAVPATPLVSRQEELQRILAAVDTVVGGSSRLVLLVGEPGIGKTRLAQEIALEAGTRGFLVASGRCYEPEGDVPFYPFLEVLATLCAAAPPAIRQEIPHRWSYLAGFLPEDILDIAPPPQRGRMGGLDEQQRLFRAVSGFVAALSEEMPVGVMLDDLQWADDASLKLLLHLARHSRGERILVLGTYRDVDVNPQHPLARALVDLNRERLVERVALHRLDERSTADLMKAIVAGDMEFEPELVAEVHRRTDGNPFFIEEVLRALTEQGALSGMESGRATVNTRDFRTPATVRAVIQQRLSRLSATTQTILHEASVLGQAFSFRDLQALSHYSEEELDDALQVGIAAALIREEGIEDYLFNHALTQQALYTELSMRRRRKLHLAAGEALHALPEAARNRRAAELARHFREGGERERAITYSLLAGDEAMSVFAYGEAEHHFRTAAELASNDALPPAGTTRASSLGRLGRVLHMTERYDDALMVLDEAADLFRVSGETQREAQITAEIGWIHRNRHTDEAGIARVQPIIARLERDCSSTGEQVILAALYTALARLCFGLRRYTEELAAARRAVELAREAGDDTALAVAEARRGAALMTVGQRELATEALKTAIVLAERTGNLGTVSVALDNLSEILRDGGDYRKAQAASERAVELAEQTGIPGRIGWTLTKLGSIHLLRGEWAQARTILEQALQLLIDDPHSAAYPRIHLGQLELLEGNWERGSPWVVAAMGYQGSQSDLWLLRHGQRLLAERDVLDGNPEAALERLRPLIESPDAREPQVTLLFGPLAWVCLELDRDAEAEVVLAEGLARAHVQNHRLAEADLRRVEGMLRARQSRRHDAWTALQEAISIASRMPDPYREAQARAEAGKLAARTGDPVQARIQLEQALAIAQRLGARPYVRRVRQSLSQLGRG